MVLARFERLMEQAVEGSLRRVFPTTLQPVQLAKAAARAMEEGRVVGLRGAEVPNLYRLYVAPADLERFGTYRRTLSRELSEYLLDYARERGLRPIATPSVELLGDSRLRTGRVRAEAQFADLPAERWAEVEAALGGTRQLRLAELAASGGGAATVAANDVATDAGSDALRAPAEAAPEPAPRRSAEPTPAPAAELWLSDDGAEGVRFALSPEWALVRIGRAADNDLVISQPRVSRYHAQLRRVESTWLVYDLDSTNGTFVDGQQLSAQQPARLTVRTRALRLGDVELRVSRSAPSAG